MNEYFVRMRRVHQLSDQASGLVPFLNHILKKDLQIAVHKENVERLSGLTEGIVR